MTLMDLLIACKSLISVLLIHIYFILNYLSKLKTNIFCIIQEQDYLTYIKLQADSYADIDSV